jgi:peptide-methionine (S)-S-oxide reductase
MRRFLLGLVLMLAAAGMSTMAGAQSASGSAAKPERAVATFAGGCFWCVESDFDKVKGVISTTSGYTGGKVVNPGYERVSAGGTGHAEAVEVAYDPTQVSYQQLLAYFWHHVDPTVKNAQFCDHGNQYRTAIFVRNDEERKLAEASKKKVEAELKKPIYTQIAAAGPFYAAEEYHQDFYKKNPTKYKFYRWNCGRDQRLEQIWGSHKGGS